jgi:hypothetical protein
LLSHIYEGSDHIQKNFEEYVNIFKLPGVTTKMAKDRTIPISNTPRIQSYYLKKCKFPETEQQEIRRKVVQMLTDGIMQLLLVDGTSLTCRK